MFKNLNIQYFKLIFISFSIISFVFLSGVKYDFFQFRYLIFLLLVPCLFKFYYDIKIKNYNFLIFFTFLFIILFTHIYSNLYYEKNELTIYSLFGVIFLLLISIISYYYFKYINKNIDFIIKFFLLIFFSSCFYNIYNYQPDAPFFCGGIPNFIKMSSMCEICPTKRLDNVRISFKEFIFNENSHLGMIAPSILAYSIYKMTSQKITIIYKFLISIFIVICFIKSSTTLYVGTILSLVIIILFNYKALNRKALLSFFLLIIFFVTNLSLSKECKTRFVPIYGTFNNDKINSNHHVTEGINKKLALKISDALDNKGSLSSGIYFHALMIAKRSIVEKPFGWGLNRYDQAFNHYNKIKPSKSQRLNNYNNKDGTNNLVKIVVEFGVFSIFIYLFIFLFLINNKISLELKLFYLPFIITQSIRGAGYFNGGFALIILLMLFTYINKYKKL